MPLYKKKPFLLLEPPQDLDPHELVYQIRFTKEILRDYQEYLNRLNLYRQKVWTCRITGKINLTYEEALVSERHAAEKVQEFPKELMAPVLSIIQYSTLSLTDLVDAIYSKLQDHFFEGLELHGTKDQSVCACKILKFLENGNTAQYEVGWLDKDKKVIETSVVMADDLIRRKAPCSRSMLKSFIRESTSQSAPWLIHEKLAKTHGISTEPPADLADRLKLLNKAGRGDVLKEISKKRKTTEEGGMVGIDMTKEKIKKEGEVPKEEPIRYPIDDLLVRPAADDPLFADRPSLSTEFKVPMDCVGDLLMIWDFCSSFGRLLNLWRFSLEDFENAICHKDSNLVLIVESHAAFLRLLINDEGDYAMTKLAKKRSSKITLVTWTEFLCDFLEMEGRAEFSKYLGTIRRGHYGLLDISIKLKIYRELVAEALTTEAIRARLDECIEQQRTLGVKRREENRRKKEDQHLDNGTTDRQGSESDKLPYGEGNACNLDMNGMHDQHEDVAPVKPQTPNVPMKTPVQENGKRKNRIASSWELAMENGNQLDEIEYVSATKEGTKGVRVRERKDKDASKKQPEEEQKDHIEKELEKLTIRTNSLGKDRNYNRYWYFRREGRLFVESSDSKSWGYYTTKEELDLLMGSLNPKGERERALKRQLEKQYQRISTALQKRSKEVAQKALLEDSELRRSTRVRAKPREKPSFLAYLNKWKDD